MTDAESIATTIVIRMLRAEGRSHLALALQLATSPTRDDDSREVDIRRELLLARGELPPVG